MDFFTREPYIKGTDAYFDALTQAFERMMSNSYDKSRIEELVKNNIERSVVLEGKIHTEYTIVDATYALLHELTHFYDHVTNPKYVEEKWRRASTNKKLTKSEIHALHVENMSRASHGDPLRSQYTVPGD